MNSRKLKEAEVNLENIELKESILEIKKDTTITVSENTNYTITIQDNIQLTIIHETQNYANININIKENIEFELVEFISNNNANYKREITQCKNSKVLVSQVIFNNAYIKTNSTLHEKCKYVLKSAYLNSECNSIIINSSTQVKPNSESNLESRGAAKNKAIINNDGIISITTGGKDCSGHQSIKNILLDNTAKINSEPILEIHNHNVTCSHGATTSKIEDEVISYIESRGLTKEQATTMIIEGFFYNSINSLTKENKNIIEKIELKL